MTLDVPPKLPPVQPLYCRAMGAGPRRVMALHCTMAHSGAWNGLAAALAGRATVCATDMLNHGQSPDWDGQGDFQDAVVRGVAAHMDGGAWDVIGHSFGATAALRLAVLYPERVRTLTLIESVYFAPVGQDAPELLVAQKAGSAPFDAAIEAGDFPLAARIFNRGWGGGDSGPPWDSLPEKLRRAMARGVRIVPHCAPAIIEDRHRLLAPGVLDRMECPVLLLRGANTAPIIAHVNDGLARRMPGAVNEVVAGAGHMLPISHPKETAARLAAFWGE